MKLAQYTITLTVPDGTPEPAMAAACDVLENVHDIVDDTARILLEAVQEQVADAEVQTS